MGYYIETKNPRRKALQLLNEYPEIRHCLHNQPQFDTTGQTVCICVVENNMFDAAAVCFSLEEARYFDDSRDMRPKTWLIAPRSTVIQLCPSVAKRLIPIQVGNSD